MIDHEAFEKAKIKVMLNQHDPHGFGTLKEKTVHAVMKAYFSPNEDYHEVPIEGYIADIYTGNQIIEIQNGNFNKMRDKLNAFLPEYDVTIVYPIPAIKWLLWVEPETGEVSDKHKSPIKGSGYHAFSELYKIKNYLKDPHLHFVFPLLEIEEYRLLNGRKNNRKKGSERYDRVPVAYVDEVVIEQLEDYMQFVPYELQNFTCAEFSKAAHIRKELGSTVLNILFYLGIVDRIGKKGNSYIYSVND